MALERVADGVWLLRGDLRGAMNIYFIEDGDGVVQFDAGTKAMRKKAAKAARELGGLKRIVLGHAHADHRGTAPYLGAPVFCHPDEVADAEGDKAIAPYFNLSLLPVAPVRWIYPTLLRRWDGGAVKVDGAVVEGDEVAGFKVLHFPGHAPGLIGLWRESARVALASAVVYLVDSTRLKPLPHGEASVPHPAWAWNHQEAKRSLRRLAELEPLVVGAGHEAPLRGENLRPGLEAAAEKYCPGPPRPPAVGGPQARCIERAAAIGLAADDRDLRLGGLDRAGLAPGRASHLLARRPARLVLAGGSGRLRGDPHGVRNPRAGTGPRDERDARHHRPDRRRRGGRLAVRLRGPTGARDRPGDGRRRRPGPLLPLRRDRALGAPRGRLQ